MSDEPPHGFRARHQPQDTLPKLPDRGAGNARLALLVAQSDLLEARHLAPDEEAREEIDSLLAQVKRVADDLADQLDEETEDPDDGDDHGGLVTDGGSETVLFGRASGSADAFYHLPDPEDPSRPRCHEHRREDRRWTELAFERLPHGATLCSQCDPNADTTPDGGDHTLHEQLVDASPEDLVTDGGQAVQSRAATALTTATSAPVRLLDKPEPTALAASCPVCGADCELLNDRITVPVGRVATEGAAPVLARALLAADVESLPTRGTICRSPGHEPIRLVHGLGDAAADGWDGQLGVPVDAGPDGLQLIPVPVEALPDGFVAAAVRGLSNRGEADE